MRMIYPTANSSDFDNGAWKKTKQIDFKIIFDVNKLHSRSVTFKGLSDIPCEAAAAAISDTEFLSIF